MAAHPFYTTRSNSVECSSSILESYSIQILFSFQYSTLLVEPISAIQYISILFGSSKVRASFKTKLAFLFMRFPTISNGNRILNFTSQPAVPVFPHMSTYGIGRAIPGTMGC